MYTSNKALVRKREVISVFITKNALKLVMICALFFFVSFRLPVATSAFYIQRYSDDKSRDIAINITKNIHNQFIEMLKKTKWMDWVLRKEAIRKVKATKFIFGYSKELTNDTLLNEYYKDLDIQESDSFLDSVLRVQRFLKNHQLAQLGMPAKLNDWTKSAMMATSSGGEFFLRENYLRACLLCSTYQLFLSYLYSTNLLFHRCFNFILTVLTSG